MKAATIAAERRAPGPIALQVEYSLVARDVESEHLPAAREGGVGVVPWSPLAGGFLSGKYQRADIAEKGRLSGDNPFGDTKFTESNWAILDALRQVAAELERPMAEVALAWTLTRDGVASTLVGASKPSQLESSIAALNIQIDTASLERLNTASAPTAGFTSGLTSPAIRQMVFGGHDVAGWGE